VQKIQFSKNIHKTRIIKTDNGVQQRNAETEVQLPAPQRNDSDEAVKLLLCWGGMRQGIMVYVVVWLGFTLDVWT